MHPRDLLRANKSSYSNLSFSPSSSLAYRPSSASLRFDYSQQYSHTPTSSPMHSVPTVSNRTPTHDSIDPVLSSLPITPDPSPNRPQRSSSKSPSVSSPKPALAALKLPVAASFPLQLTVVQAPPRHPSPLTPPDESPVAIPPSPPSFVVPSPEVEYDVARDKLLDYLKNQSCENGENVLQLTNIREATFNKLLEAASKGRLGQVALRMRKVMIYHC